MAVRSEIVVGFPSDKLDKRSFSRGGGTSAADLEESMKIRNLGHILTLALCNYE